MADGGNVPDDGDDSGADGDSGVGVVWGSEEDHGDIDGNEAGQRALQLLVRRDADWVVLGFSHESQV